MPNINTQEQTYKKPGIGTIAGGAVVGYTIVGLTQSPNKMLTSVITQNMNEINKHLTEDEFKSVEKAIKTTIKESGLAEKGVSVIRSNAENQDEILKIIKTELDNKPSTRRLPEEIKIYLGKAYHTTLQKSENAFFTFKSNKIIMPEKGLNLVFFHEAGHAANQNLSAIGKALQKCRWLSALALPIALVALFKTKKAPNEKPNSKTDKTTTFIKNNAGKLTFAAFLPLLLEEGLASIKGNKFAKKVLSPHLFKKVLKTNAFSFSSYLITATLSSLSIYLGAKVKDMIAKPELVKNNQN